MYKTTVLACLFLIGVSVAAQDTPKFEVFGGYAYANTSRLFLASRSNLNGWNASFTYNFNRWVGITGDASGYYGSSSFNLLQAVGAPCGTTPCPITFVPFRGTADMQSHTFLAGPQVSWRNHSRATPFAHVLFGMGHLNLGEHAPPFIDSFHLGNNAFAMAMGGGVDVKLTSRLAWRVQPDYLQTDFLHATQKNLRVSTGLVFKFGSK